MPPVRPPCFFYFIYSCLQLSLSLSLSRCLLCLCFCRLHILSSSFSNLSLSYCCQAGVGQAGKVKNNSNKSAVQINLGATCKALTLPLSLSLADSLALHPRRGNACHLPRRRVTYTRRCLVMNLKSRNFSQLVACCGHPPYPSTYSPPSLHSSRATTYAVEERSLPESVYLFRARAA